MERINETRTWWQEFSKKKPTHRAVKLLKRINIAERCEYNITLLRIANACFNAAHYQPERDPGKLYRNNIQAEKRRLNQLANAAHVLALSARRGDKSLNWACEIAEKTSGVRITRKDYSEPMKHHLVVEKYFSHLETALRGNLPEFSNKGAWLHKYTIGNLIYEKPISRGKPINTETMLAFELAIYLRMYTAGRAKDGTQTGQPMPDDGEPCFSVVAAFCHAVFETTFDAKTIGDKVRDLRNAGLSDWQGVNSD